jgi:hypothetical protein
MSQFFDFPFARRSRMLGSPTGEVAMGGSPGSNVVPLHPHLTARDHAHLELLELLRELDPDSQRVLLHQLERSLAIARPRSPAAKLLRGDRGPVSWRRGEGPQWLVAPMSRRWVRQRARA